MESIDGTIYEGPDAGDGVDREGIPDVLAALLMVRNGLIAFHGGLHIRGIGAVPEWHSIEEVWRGEHALHKVYVEVLETDIPFAQDCFGDQYLLRDEAVVKLMAEMGYVEQIAENLGEFLAAVVEDPREMLELEPLEIFREDGGELEPGMLLQVYPPFCSDEAEEGVTISAIPTFARLEFLFDYSRSLGASAD